MENGSQLSVTEWIKNDVRGGLYRFNGMAFAVHVLDARKVWGRVDLLISPVNGEGQKWVEASTVKLN